MEWRGQVRQSRAEAVIRSGGPPSREWTRPERAAGWALGSMRLDCTQRLIPGDLKGPPGRAGDTRQEAEF